MKAVLSELEQRGLIQDTTDKTLLENLPLGTSFYVGFDPTAPHLQLGNLLPLIVVIHLAKAGLKPLILFGGATGCIGDPSGKSKERVLLDRSTITTNISKQRRKAEELLTRCALEATYVDNNDWTKDVGFIDFLRDTGKCFTVNYMMQKDSVKSRLEGGGISFTEFCYMLLQAHDFYHLRQNHDCRLQIGGADQWGNMTAGLELIRKKGLDDAHALSIPLITDSSGAKFGKSEGGAIWLDKQGTSPYTLHQFFLNVTDQDAVRYLKLLTFIPLQEIEQIAQEMQINPASRIAQKRLADTLCEFIHGEEETAYAKRGAEALFSGETTTEEELKSVLGDIPTTSLSAQTLRTMSLVELLEHTSLAPSRSEAKKLLKNGGVYLNNQRVNDVNLRVESALSDSTTMLLLRIGKKRYHAIRIEDA